MALVKSIEKKIKINKAVSIAAMLVCTVLSISSFAYSYILVKDARKSIYILDNGVPIFVKQTDELLNRPVEYKSQIDLFHRIFFTLAPDDEFIKENINKSLYLIDESGKKEYANLRDKGFYNQLVASNAMMTIRTDSIKIDLANKSFKYFGVQTINRKTSLITRLLITEGNFDDMTRTPNNPHGVLLKNWRIIDNSELTNKARY